MGKIAAKISKRLSIRTVTSLRDIFEKTWVHRYPLSTLSRSILVENVCAFSIVFIVFTFVVCDT